MGYYPLQTYPLTDRMALQVNLANGNLLVRATDLVVRGTGLDLVVDRTYNNLSTGAGSIADRWSLSLGNDVSLQNPAASTITFVGPSGYQVNFTQNPDGSYASPPGLDATLVKNGDGSFTLTFHATGERYDFTSAGMLSAEVDRDGNTIAFTYGNPNDPLNPGDGLAAITDTQGRQVSFLYNAFGFIGTMTDATGRQATYAPDGSSNLASYTDLAGKQTAFTYDITYGTNNLLQITDPAGRVTQLQYDASNRVTSITFGSGTAAGTYTFTYNSGSTVVTDPNNHQTTYAYDGQGRLTQMTDALGNAFQWAWTADDHVSQYTDAKQQQWQYGYDANNNLTSVQSPSSTQGVAGPVLRWAYGTVANIPSFYVPTSTTDAQGNQTTYQYDGNGDLTTITDQLPSQNVTHVYYNANGTVDHVVDARGNTTSYGYDAKGNLTKITPPGPMGATTIVPDALSRVSSVTDGKGQQRTYTYDNLDRVTALSYPAYAAGNVGWAYDADGNATSMTDGTGTTTYSYDARNRQTGKVLPASLGGGHFGYSYDGAGNLTQLDDEASVPGQGLVVTYGYDAAGEATSLTENGKTTTFAYTPDHQRNTTTYPDGVVLAQHYDNAGRTTTINGFSGGSTLSSFAYTYLKGGLDTLLPQTYQETLAAPNNGPTAQVNGSMTYDPLDRLTKWLVTKQADGSVVHDYAYQYDGDSNRTQVIADPVNAQGQIVSDPSQGTPHSNESDLSFNAPNEIAQVQPYGTQGQTLTPVAYGYDAAGNQTGNNGGGTGKPLTITYYPTNQTQSVSDVNQNAEAMTWAGAGQEERVKRTWTDQGTSYSATYTWSLLGLSGYSNNGVGEPKATTSVVSGIVRDPSGTPIAQRYSNGREYYYLFDGRGDVVGLEDPGAMQAATRWTGMWATRRGWSWRIQSSSTTVGSISGDSRARSEAGSTEPARRANVPAGRRRQTSGSWDSSAGKMNWPGGRLDCPRAHPGVDADRTRPFGKAPDDGS